MKSYLTIISLLLFPTLALAGVGSVNPQILPSDTIKSKIINLKEVVVTKSVAQKRSLRQLRDIEGTTINSGRKNEVVLLNDMTINKVSNNARQIFSKVVGLTINESSDGGLQLNVGGRGLNPNRTSNFNTRQNGYDISADVLGYPENYYTPPAEALREIQVIRGAASLQYGTQFGGLLNFKMKLPSIETYKLNQRLSYGSYNMLSSFTDLSGSIDKFSYYSYFNYKQGDGFRPNSKFNSYNGFINLNYRLPSNAFIKLDLYKYHYLAKQAGGLTDFMFRQNIFQSNRNRNWFKIDWNGVNLSYNQQLDSSLKYSLNIFGLLAERSALGYRSYRVSQPDDTTSPRDLLVGKFCNWGSEFRLIKKYHLYNKLKHSLLLGAKYYQSYNSSQQGAGSASADADFNFDDRNFPNYERRSSFNYPNLNLAFFSENIFRLGKNTTITPGLRMEFIKTQSIGSYRIIYSHAGRILNDQTIEDKVSKPRFIFLGGIAVAHKFDKLELYGNFSQNYRSVTFNDIHSSTPGFAISPNISDEKGFSSDIGLRGKFFKSVFIDCSAYALYYGNKIGEYYHTNKQTGAVERYRDNVGVAFSYGFESLINWDINETFWQNENLSTKLFLNTAFTGSRYLQSDIPNIKGNKVEFVPLINLKTGLDISYKDFSFSTQLAFVSSQFAEATNRKTNPNENTYGIFGEIPSYYVWDASASYKFSRYIKLELSLQNLTNHIYFTQRATGYPGPGIIPSAPFNFMSSIAFTL